MNDVVLPKTEEGPNLKTCKICGCVRAKTEICPFCSLIVVILHANKNFDEYKRMHQETMASNEKMVEILEQAVKVDTMRLLQPSSKDEEDD